MALFYYRSNFQEFNSLVFGFNYRVSLGVRELVGKFFLCFLVVIFVICMLI